MTRYLPLGLSAVVILAAAIFNGFTTERWTGGVNEQTLRFARSLELLPMQIGLWQGADEEVDEDVQRVAGAEGYLSRVYKNEETGDIVRVWLIVGHGSSIVRHTPDVCYGTAGFRPEKPQTEHYEMPVEGEKPIEAWTNVFYSNRGGQDIYNRVFWMWYDPRVEGPVTWDAPGHHVSDARYRFGASRSLFKMYFTTLLDPKNSQEQPPENVANKFAQEFVPVLNDLLLKAKRGEIELPADQQAEVEESPDADEDIDAPELESDV